jgi:lipoprotein LprG
MKRIFCIFAVWSMVTVMVITSCAKQTASPQPLTASQIIDKSSEKMQAINSFHFVLDQVGGGTPIAMGIEMKKAYGDVVRPDRLKMTISGTVSGMSLEVQMITVSGVMYMTNPLSGKWELPPAEFKVLSVLDPNTFIATVMTDVTGLTELNAEELAGVPCYHLSGSINSDDLSAITGSSVKGVVISIEVWIGKDDLLVRNIKVAGKITETELPGIVRTLDLSNFDQEVSIILPE